MTPLRQVAMGLVIVFLRADFGGWDALPDPLGWGLVLAGVWLLRRRLPGADLLLWLGALAAVVSVPLVLPAVAGRLAASGQWAASLPQTAFCLVMCGALATWVDRRGVPTDPAEPDVLAVRGRRVGALRWVFLVVGAGPVLVYGGGVDALATPLAVLAVAANVALVWWTFGLSRLDRAPAPEA